MRYVMCRMYYYLVVGHITLNLVVKINMVNKRVEHVEHSSKNMVYWS